MIYQKERLNVSREVFLEVAKSDVHFAQYKRNKALIAELQDPQKFKEMPYDWVVVVAFYTAVQLVETCIKRNGKKSKDHFQRLNHIRDIKTLKPIDYRYNSLEHFSRQARYDCVPFNSATVKAPLRLLSEIEQHVLPLVT